MADDGSTYLAGTRNTSSEENEAHASCDFLVYKIDEGGNYVWNWKVRFMVDPRQDDG